MAWMRRTAALALAVFAGAALAQAPQLQPSAAQQCLTHVAGKDAQPDYPIAEYNHNVGGRVQVELTFTRPDRAPEVSVLLQHASQRLVDAVLEHVGGLRVPCLDAKSGPVRLGQDFVFAADHRRVHWTDPLDAVQRHRAALLTCLVHADGSTRPEYPRRARLQQVQGRVLARLRFSTASDPPEVEVFARDYAEDLTRAVREWLQGVRLPCLDNEPIAGLWSFQFVFEGERYGFKELSFRQFLGSAKGIRQQTLVLDTRTMGCPFDLRLHYRQPALRNGVGEVGEPNPARRPLLEWMAATELDLNGKSLDSIFGDFARITVPCLKIDLKPQEKS